MIKPVVSVVNSFAGLERLADRWSVLQATHPGCGLFNSFIWNHLWWQHYGLHDPKSSLHVLTVHAGSKLVAIAPFYLTSGRMLRVIRVTTLRFIGSGGDTAPDDLDVLCAPGHESSALPALCDHLLSGEFATRLQLADLAEMSAFRKVLDERMALSPGYRAPLRWHRKRHAELAPTWAEQMARFSRNTRKHVRRRRQRLHRAGEVVCSPCESPAAVESALASLIRLHTQRRATAGGSDSFRTRRYIDFHRALMLALLARQELWLYELRLDERTIGVEYAFCFNGTLSFFQCGFDPADAELSPGHNLMVMMIEAATGAGLHRIDLLKGDYPYKASYADRVHRSVDVIYYKPGLLAQLARLKSMAGGWRRRLQGNLNRPA